MIFKVVLSAFLATVVLANPTKLGRDGFVTIGDQDYYFSTNRTTWVDATGQCNLLGLRLLSLPDDVKNGLIRQYMIEEYPFGQWWTSGQRVAGSWMWAGLGQLFDFTDWGEGQPDLTDGEICLNVRGWYGWYDDPCEAPHYYVCE